jgi:5-methylcytosine-specific restriction protein A
MPHAVPTFRPRRVKAVELRPSSDARGYDSRWRRFRAWFLTEHPVCEIRHHCNGDTATDVDHVTPMRRGGEQYELTNLQAACHACHSWKTRTYDMGSGSAHRDA